MLASSSLRVLGALTLSLTLAACSGTGDEPDTPTKTTVTSPPLVAADMSGADMRPAQKDMQQGGEQDMSPGADMPAQVDMSAPEDMRPSAPGACPKTSRKIGWTATLSTRAHGVSGAAVIVDDCTVEIRDFSYDGTGLDVRVYGSQSTDFSQGWPMTEDIRRPGGYSGELLVATLPEGQSMDELEAVSIWCLDIPVDFGSGTFTSP